MHDTPVRVRAVRQHQLPHVLDHQVARPGLLDRGDDHRPGRVPEQSAVQHRLHARRPGIRVIERGEILGRDHQGPPAGPAAQGPHRVDQGVPAADTRRGRQPDPLDIRPQPQPPDQVDIQARNRPGRGVRGDQHIHLPRPHPRLHQRVLRRRHRPVPRRLVRGP
ncbi:hypothetical protein OHA69_41425 [Streptomyces anulatus]|nr:hypothetical protein [Streptomyces anulatus]MCX4524054.1 hypothetical protein [Streptomyces anulatus]